MLTVLGGLAEFERDLIRKRMAEGRERAKARGVRLGLWLFGNRGVQPRIQTVDRHFPEPRPTILILARLAKQRHDPDRVRPIAARKCGVKAGNPSEARDLPHAMAEAAGRAQSPVRRHRRNDPSRAVRLSVFMRSGTDPAIPARIGLVKRGPDLQFPLTRSMPIASIPADGY